MRVRPFQLAAKLLLLIFLSATFVSAQSLPSRVGHYIRTHKRLLIADTLLMAGWAADAASSVHDQKSGCCVELNSLLGPHPSELQTWSYAMGIGAALVVGEHLIWWAGNKYGDPEAGHILIWPAPIAHGISEYFTVRDNAKYAADSNLAIARARLAH